MKDKIINFVISVTWGIAECIFAILAFILTITIVGGVVVLVVGGIGAGVLHFFPFSAEHMADPQYSRMGDALGIGMLSIIVTLMCVVFPSGIIYKIYKWLNKTWKES